jgi:hypothetical protein
MAKSGARFPNRFENLAEHETKEWIKSVNPRPTSPNDCGGMSIG